MKRLLLPILLLLVGAGDGQEARAQYRVTPDVFGCGGQPIQNTSYRLNGTIGEPVIGVTQNTTRVKHLGFWYITAETKTSVDRVSDGEPSFRLEQNYPNPVRGETRIGFTLHRQDAVELVITDACGRRVATPIRTLIPSGSYQVTWDAGDLPPGVYLYTLRTPTRSVTRRLVLVR